MKVATASGGKEDRLNHNAARMTGKMMFPGPEHQ